DEGHRATSQLAQQTIEQFNASIIVELSATPPDGSNQLVRISGRELLDEEMIKLPINVSNSNQQSWKDCLAQARDQREMLAQRAVEHYRASGVNVRPIVLVQVERTGETQQDVGLVHSDHVKQQLI